MRGEGEWWVLVDAIKLGQQLVPLSNSGGFNECLELLKGAENKT